MVKVLILDLETRVEFIEEIDDDTGKKKKSIDNSPFNPNNYIVSANWRKVYYEPGQKIQYHRNNGIIGPDQHGVYRHNDLVRASDRSDLEAAIAWADRIVAHNAKYDIMWLLEAGFTVPDNVYCTMIGEYILARGVEGEFSLKATAERRNVTRKKSDLVDDMFKAGRGFEAMPLPIVLEYADADVLSCAEIYIEQQKDWEKEENKTLTNIVDLMNEMLLFLVEIERNGIKINLERLAVIEKDYREEHAQLMSDLTNIARSVMGDEPFSLTSGPDISKIVYSREIVDKVRHKDIFKLGADRFGNKQYPPWMTDAAFAQAVRTTTRIIKKKTAHHCELCHGKGKIRKFKKSGDPFKNETACPRCGGAGYTLTETPSVAGLRLVPERPSDASMNGFAVSKDQMDRLIAQATRSGKDAAVEFLTKKKRLNAVNTYLNSFVEGIKRWTRADNLLHAQFNQTIAATGRLSSSRPNFQNQPKERKFPIRSCVISRFENGVITECDFSGLEFVVAGELSRDPQIIEDILNDKDVHGQTAGIVHQKPDPEINWKDKDHKDIRNEVKPHTFAPLYGGTGANEPDHIRTYYKEFFNIYKRHGEWQVEQMDSVITKGFVRTPSGREYAFPGTRRLKGGQTTNGTKIKNYPVQGFATGDIVPLACIRAYRRFKELELKSKLILTVHDSIAADTHPDEKAIVAETLVWATTGVVDEIKERWNYEMVLPLKSEVSQGPDWMDMESI